MDPTNPRLSDDDVRACVRVLRAIEADRSHLTRLTQDERRELLTLAGLVSKPERRDLVRMAKAFRRAEREAEKEHDREVLDQAGLRIQRRSATYAPLWLEPPKPEDLGEGREFRQERDCYVCKRPFATMHRYYDSLCVGCGDFNYAKREQTADLSGQTALVTGGRVKIGFQTSLKLLRAGAQVILTTRFPVDAAERYAAEADFEAFRDRLQIHGLDLRHTPSVEIFTRFLLERLPRLDHIVNNACQTVRRPAGFFEHLLAREAAAARRAARGLARDAREPRRVAAHARDARRRTVRVPSRPPRRGGTARGCCTARPCRSGAIWTKTFAAARRCSRPADTTRTGNNSICATSNSWRLRLHEVETPELLEVQLVNAIAPYILNARLKPLMLRTPGRHKHVVNVSAMEGQFYRTTKTDKHPHTNMAKAALNMMTRTSAPDWVKDGIHMNAVDTGWVTDEDPAIHAARKAELGFSPPLDIIDGAARIADPIFAGRLTGIHVWGQFLKDYKPAPW